MRTVGQARISSPSLNPSAQGLIAARAHQATGMALAAVATTGIRKGIYRFATHEEMNSATDQALVRVVHLNTLARKAQPAD